MDKNKRKYLIGWNIILLIAIPFLTMFYPAEGNCNQKVKVVVKTIHASKNSNSIDPRIRNLVKEFKSVVKYSGYKLLDEKNLSLTDGKKVVIQIPGGRTMSITSKGVNGGRVSLEIEYFKGKNNKLTTSIGLPNNDDASLAGPEYDGGVLFFNILATF